MMEVIRTSASAGGKGGKRKKKVELVTTGQGFTEDGDKRRTEEKTEGETKGHDCRDKRWRRERLKEIQRGVSNF